MRRGVKTAPFARIGYGRCMVFDFRHKNVEGKWRSSGFRKGIDRDAAFASLERRTVPCPRAGTCLGPGTAGPRTGTCSPDPERRAHGVIVTRPKAVRPSTYAWAAAASASGKVRSISTCRLAVGHPPDQVADHRVDPRVLGEQRPAEVDAAQGVVLPPQRFGLDSRAGSGGDPDADQRPPVGERLDAVDEVLAADRVQDDVDAAAVGQLADLLDEALSRRS